MTYEEYESLQIDLDMAVLELTVAAKKLTNGDIRGARIRLQAVLKTVEGIEPKCNPSGVLLRPAK